jgi:hypothetical protein
MTSIAVDTHRSSRADAAFLMLVFGARQALLNFLTDLTNMSKFATFKALPDL